MFISTIYLRDYNDKLYQFQQYKESDEAQRYLTFYPITEWPHVTVIDPRTGEKLITWNHLDSASFCELVSQFLEAHPNFDENGENGSAPKRKRLRSVSTLINKVGEIFLFII